jgi:hypothetical protein
MSIQDHIAAYAEGWTVGDTEKILAAAAPDFLFDDPNAGQITRDGLADYVSAFKGVAAELRDGQEGGNLMELSEVVIKDDEMPVSIWAWWVVPGTAIAGSALIKVGEEGVVSERIAYYTALPK